MMTIFRYTVVRLRGQIIGWGLALALLGLIVAPLYDTVVQQRAQLEKLIRSLPPEFMAFIGNLDNMFSPAGYLNARYFSFLPLILGIFAVLIGSGLIVSDEENGTLDLILAHPISRIRLFIERWLAFGMALLGITALAWLGLAIALGASSIRFGALDMLRPFMSLLAVLVWYGALAVMLSMILPSRRLAASLSGLILVASFFISAFARLSPTLAGIAELSPLNYYQGGDAIQGLNVGWFIGLLVVSTIFVAIALWRFQRRDIRVAGEGGWPSAARPRMPSRPHTSA